MRDRPDGKGASPRVIDATEPLDRLLGVLRSSREGLTDREAARRLVAYGPNEIRRSRGSGAWRQLGRQFVHPLALLLWAAALLAWIGGIVAVSIAVIAVIVLNAAFAFGQERQAERAVEALVQYLPQHARVLRDRAARTILATELVPGDVLEISEGERISADARLISGTLEVDASALTGESVPVERAAAWTDMDGPLIEARDLVFSGTACTGGEARAVVVATGMQTELGRIAALTEGVAPELSPLERQVRRVAWLIGGVAVGLAVAFMPVATLAGGLDVRQALVFAVGLIVGNVPEGLLPVITLALAMSVRELARHGAVVKRLSGVETLGSADVICTDKTGTLTENRMRVTDLWTTAGRIAPAESDAAGTAEPFRQAARVMAACNNAERPDDSEAVGDATEVALLDTAASLGLTVDRAVRDRDRLAEFHFDPGLKLMTTVDLEPEDGDPSPGPGRAPGRAWIDTKGAPESLLPLCDTVMRPSGEWSPLDEATLRLVREQVDDYARRGLRVLALATRPIKPGEPTPSSREQAERHLGLLGLAAMVDPPRSGVTEAVERCHRAGIRVIVITGDHPLTAAAVARSVGIGSSGLEVVTGDHLDAMGDPELDDLLRGGEEIVFARSSPEDKLRIADALRAEGHIIAMTGDGVNDAPALRSADIGVAMGRSGTDVAREAATMVLTDDNFATIVSAVAAGRRVYDNIRKFILYIFSHAPPEIIPYLVFALARGAVPLPLTILQLLAIDVGTETFPALALGREPAEPGIMNRPPRPRGEGVIRGEMLLRAWLFLGLIAAALQMGAFFWVLISGGWHPGDPVGPGQPLHHVYLQATTMTFLSMVMGQVGTAFAARVDRASLRSVGVMSNPSLLLGIVFELALAWLIIYAPPLQEIFQTAALPPHMLLFVLPFPFIVWGADELRRYALRRWDARGRPPAGERLTRPRTSVA